MPPRPHLALPSPGTRRAVVVGAGSFVPPSRTPPVWAPLVRHRGRGAARPRRLPHHAADAHARAVPRGSRPTARTAPTCPASRSRASCASSRPTTASAASTTSSSASPRSGSASVIASLSERGLDRRTPVISLAKGLVPPHGIAPTVLLTASLGASRVACVGGPAHAHEMVTEGAGARRRLRPTRGSPRRSPTSSRARAWSASSRATRSASSSPAPPRTPPRSPRAPPRRQGLNAAGAAAGHIFLEVWRYAEQQGARPESMIGLAGTGDLVGTALAPQSRNRQAGELLAAGRPGGRDPRRASARRSRRSTSCRCSPTRSRAPTIDAPVTNALNRLIAGELPLDEWVAQVRATVPPPARFGSAVAWARWRQRMKALRASPLRTRSGLAARRSLRDLCRIGDQHGRHSVSPTSSTCCSAPLAVGVVVAVLAVTGALPDKVERTTAPPRRRPPPQSTSPASPQHRAHERRRHLRSGSPAASSSSPPAAATASSPSRARAAARPRPAPAS